MCAWVMNSALLYGSQQMGIMQVSIEISFENFIRLWAGQWYLFDIANP